jgi:hypothetical protein
VQGRGTLADQLARHAREHRLHIPIVGAEDDDE